MHGEGYGSEFDDGTGSRKRKRPEDISYKKTDHKNYHGSKLPSKEHFREAYSKEQHRLSFAKFKSLNAYERHQKLVHDYLKYYGGKAAEFNNSQTTVKTDYDVLEENHQFVWDEDDDEDSSGRSWGQRLAKKYYDKLFKEYCISDVSRYKHNQFAMRWRTEKEVHSGKGQFSCGARKCEEGEGLKTWEVNFAYVEHEVKKNCLIKLRLCPDCSYKLNYHKKHKQVKAKRKKEKKKRKKKKKKKSRKSGTDSASSGSESESESQVATTDKGIANCSKDGGDEGSIWTQPIEEPSEKTKDDLFDDYLEDLFM